MKFLKNQWVAIVLVVLTILGTGFYGLRTAPTRVPELPFGEWAYDDAQLLSQQTEELIQRFNDQLSRHYDSLMPVATVKELKNYSTEDYAFDLGESWGLGEQDMLLLINAADRTCYLAYGSEAGERVNASNMSAAALQKAVDDYIDADFFSGDSDDQMALFLNSVSNWYRAYYNEPVTPGGLFPYQNGYGVSGGTYSGRISWLAILLTLLVLAVFLAGLRAGIRRRRYLGYGPIFVPFWSPRFRGPWRTGRNPGPASGARPHVGFGAGSTVFRSGRGSFGSGSRNGFGGGRSGFGGGGRGGFSGGGRGGFGGRRR